VDLLLSLRDEVGQRDHAKGPPFELPEQNTHFARVYISIINRTTKLRIKIRLHLSWHYRSLESLIIPTSQEARQLERLLLYPQKLQYYACVSACDTLWGRRVDLSLEHARCCRRHLSRTKNQTQKSFLQMRASYDKCSILQNQDRALPLRHKRAN
jgi:hypothetical protein